ncbi:unnamed protein product [Lampetra fluviatilis]
MCGLRSPGVRASFPREHSWLSARAPYQAAARSDSSLPETRRNHSGLLSDFSRRLKPRRCDTAPAAAVAAPHDAAAAAAAARRPLERCNLCRFLPPRTDKLATCESPQRETRALQQQRRRRWLINLWWCRPRLLVTRVHHASSLAVGLGAVAPPAPSAAVPLLNTSSTEPTWSTLPRAASLAGAIEQAARGVAAASALRTDGEHTPCRRRRRTARGGDGWRGVACHVARDTALTHGLLPAVPAPSSTASSIANSFCSSPGFEEALAPPRAAIN